MNANEEYRQIINKKWDVDINEYDFSKLISKNPTFVRNLYLQELIIRQYKQEKEIEQHYAERNSKVR